MKILVIGGCSFIGSNLVNYIIGEHREVWVFDYKLGMDTIDISKVLGAVALKDLIFLFAGSSKLQGDSFKGTSNVIKACKIHGVPLVFISSSRSLNPETEEEAEEASEELLCKTLKDVNIRIARTFDAYGPGAPETDMVTSLIKTAAASGTISIENNEYHDWTYIDDIVEGIWRTRGKPPGTIENIRRGSSIPNKKLAEIIKIKVENVVKDPIEIEVKETRDMKEVPDAGITKRAKTPLEEGIETTVAQEKAAKDGVIKYGKEKKKKAKTSSS